MTLIKLGSCNALPLNEYISIGKCLIVRIYVFLTMFTHF